MQPLTLTRRPTLAHTFTFGAGGTYTGGGGGGGGGGGAAPGGGGGGGGGGGCNASFSSYSGSEQPLTSTCLPPIDPHTASAVGACTSPTAAAAIAPASTSFEIMKLMVRPSTQRMVRNDRIRVFVPRRTAAAVP